MSTPRTSSGHSSVTRVRASLVGMVVLAIALAAQVVVAGPAKADQTFGDNPLQRVLEAADRHGDDCADTSRRLSRDQLAALVIAPTFPETGTSTTQAPSPMTLGRYDTQAQLHSYGDSATYPSAFWTAGIGSWQWDDASLFGFSASERIDQAFIVDRTTDFIAQRWCDGRGFDSVWSPWYGCRLDRCKAIHDAIYQDGTLVNVALDPTVGRLGGMEERTCTTGGASFTCWFVDPSRAQGFAGFAVPAFGPAPLPSPFYSFEVAGHEQRHFLRAHTGYDRDIRASLRLGLNSRSPGALAWSTGSALCDLTAGIGDCGGDPPPPPPPPPPPGPTPVPDDVPADAIAVTADWNGDGVDTPGWFHDGKWWMTDLEGSYSTLAYGQAGDKPVTGDWDGDGVDTVGVVRGNLFILRSDYRRGAQDVVMAYGQASDTPVTGDWDGDGVDTLGVVRGNLFILRSVYKRGADDVVMAYGQASDTPVTGDWDGDGVDTLGVVRGNLFILRSEYKRGADDVVMAYGQASDTPVVGNWNGDHRDTLGVVRDRLWILRSTYVSGASDLVLMF